MTAVEHRYCGPSAPPPPHSGAGAPADPRSAPCGVPSVVTRVPCVRAEAGPPSPSREGPQGRPATVACHREPDVTATRSRRPGSLSRGRATVPTVAVRSSVEDRFPSSSTARPPPAARTAGHPVTGEGPAPATSSPHPPGINVRRAFRHSHHLRYHLRGPASGPGRLFAVPDSRPQSTPERGSGSRAARRAERSEESTPTRRAKRPLDAETGRARRGAPP